MFQKINFVLKNNFPITKEGKATLAPVEIIRSGFSFINILKISYKFKNKFIPLIP